MRTGASMSISSLPSGTRSRPTPTRCRGCARAARRLAGRAGPESDRSMMNGAMLDSPRSERGTYPAWEQAADKARSPAASAAMAARPASRAPAASPSVCRSVATPLHPLLTTRSPIACRIVRDCSKKSTAVCRSIAERDLTQTCQRVRFELRFVESAAEPQAAFEDRTSLVGSTKLHQGHPQTVQNDGFRRTRSPWCRINASAAS